MPIHDWTRVDSGLFHDFHQSWTVALRDALNAGVLPPDYFALVEQRVGGPIPDVLTLSLTSAAPESASDTQTHAVATAPPRMAAARGSPAHLYARKANRITVRHRHGRVVALIVLPYGWREALLTSQVAIVLMLSIVVITGYVGQISIVQLPLAGVAGFTTAHIGASWRLGFPLAPLLGVLHHAHDPRVPRVGRDPRRAHDERRIAVDRARQDRGARALRNEKRLAGEIRLVHRAVAFEDVAVHGTDLVRKDLQNVTDLHSIYRHVLK